MIRIKEEKIQIKDQKTKLNQKNNIEKERFNEKKRIKKC